MLQRNGGAKLPGMGQIVRSALIAMAALFAILPAAASARPQQRIVAVGDLHGDYAAWLNIARAAGIIDAAGHWAGGRTTLVQLGDILDREPDSLKIVRSLQQLQKEAPRTDGRVVVVLGNHEAMNLLGDFRYTTPGEFAAFAGPDSAAVRDRIYDQDRTTIEAAARASNPALTPQQIRAAWMTEHPLGWVEHKIAWGPSGELGRWAARNRAVVKIDGTLFVHGGLSAEFAKLPIDEINRRVAAAMSAGDDGPTTILYDPLGPLWYRGLVANDPDAAAVRAKLEPGAGSGGSGRKKEGMAAPFTGRQGEARAKLVPPHPPMTADQELDAVLSAYGAKRLVIGHTPDLKGIEFLGNGRLARIDSGNSRAYGGPLTWIEIVGGKMIPHSVPRSAQ